MATNKSEPSVMERCVLELALHLGRNLMAEVKRQLAYRASRKDASDYIKFLAPYFAHHESIMIDRRLWNSASLTLSDEANLLLQFVEHFVSLAPHSIMCQSQRHNVILQANRSLQAYVDAMHPVIEKFEEAEQTHFAKTTRDGRVAILEKSLGSILSEALAKFNFGMSPDSLLIDASEEDIVNAIYFDNFEIQTRLLQKPSDKQYFTKYVAEKGDDDDDGESGSPPAAFLNITYPRYIPPRSFPPPKATSVLGQYEEMDELNKTMADSLFLRMVNPVFQMLKANVKAKSRFPTVSMAANCFELLCISMLDLYSRGVIDSPLVKRYCDNMLYILAGLDGKTFDLPSVAVPDTLVTTQTFFSRDACFLMKMSNFGFIQAPLPSRILDGYVVLGWQDEEIKTLKQIQEIYPGHPQIKSLSGLPPDVYAVPLISAYGPHEKYIGDFASIMRGESNKLSVQQLERIEVLELVGESQEPRLASPKVLDSFTHEQFRILDPNGEFAANVSSYPRFVMSQSERAKMNAHAKWQINVAKTLPAKQYALLCNPKKGWGSAFKAFEDGLRSRHAGQFMERFVILLDKLIELFASHKSLFYSFNKCKSLVSASDADAKIPIVSGFSKAMDSAAPSVARYCSILNVCRRVHGKVSTALMVHNADQERLFQAQLRAGTQGEVLSGSNLSSNVFDSESVVVFKWDDVTLADSPSTIIADRNDLRSSISLLQIAQAIDQNLASNEMLAKINLSLNLAESLQILAVVEMIAEDDCIMNEMSLLVDLFKAWSPSQTNPSIDNWIPFILQILPIPNNAPDADPLTKHAWFSVEPYMRRLLVESWYLPKDCFELSVTAKKAESSKIAMAPLSQRRRPLMLDSSGPLSIVLDLINNLCVDSVQFTKTYFEDKFSEMIERVYNGSSGLRQKRTDLIQMVMPKVLVTDEYQNTVEQWGDTWNPTGDDDDEDDEDDDDGASKSSVSKSKNHALSFIGDFASALLQRYADVSDAVNTFAKNSGILPTNVVVRCMRICVEIVFSGCATRLMSSCLMEKRRIFDAWTAYRRAVDSAPSFAKALDTIKPIELQRLMLPAPVIENLLSYFGNITDSLNSAHQLMDSLMDEKTVSSFIDTMVTPILKLMNQGSENTSIAQLLEVKSERITNAIAEGMNMHQFITEFIDEIDDLITQSKGSSSKS